MQMVIHFYSLRNFIILLGKIWLAGPEAVGFANVSSSGCSGTVRFVPGKCYR